jgi:RNA polymerase sigma-70 factor (ECF subfamily)
MRIDANAWRQIGAQGDQPTHITERPDIAAAKSQTGSQTLTAPLERRAPDAFRDAVIALIPALRIHAAMRVKSRSEADDLVQETLVRAWCYRGSFQTGSNLKAWLCKIMQNCFYHDLSRQRDTVQDIEGRWAAMQTVAPAQEWRLQYNDMLCALDHLPPDARAALVLIGASGCSYEEAAELAHCPVGTLKSRVNRAREKLASLIDNGAGIPHSRLAKSLAKASGHIPKSFPEQACIPVGEPSLQPSEE